MFSSFLSKRKDMAVLRVPKNRFWVVALKASAVAVFWEFFPFWVFLLVALYMYLTPWFRPLSMFLPFVSVLILASIMPASLSSAVFLAILFALILGIKNLYIIDREVAYLSFLILYIFIILLHSFGNFRSWESAVLPVWFFGVAVIFFTLILGYLKILKESREDRFREKEIIPGTALLALLLFEGGTILMFLPLAYFYQTSILFTFIIMSFFALLDYLRYELSSRRALIYFSIFFVIIVIALAGTEWRI